ncbi:MAG: hypothetical protein ACM3O7_03860 [Acidobacteriota bacterium]
MVVGVVLAAVAAVLTSHEVDFVETGAGKILRRAALPSEGLAVFAAPDARVLVPLAGDDATAVVTPQGEVSRWPGHLFPLFFDEMDRMHVVVPGAVATLSYPERLPLNRVDVAGLLGARRAACSHDGRLVVVAPAGTAAPSVLLVAAAPGGSFTRVALAAEPLTVAAAPDAAWAAVGLADGTVVLVGLSAPAASAPVAVGGEVTGLAVSPDGRWLVVAARSGQVGRIEAWRIDARASPPLKEKIRTATDAPVDAVAVAGDEVVAIVNGSVSVFGRMGRKELRRVPLPGARALSMLPDRPESVLPAWSDR